VSAVDAEQPTTPPAEPAVEPALDPAADPPVALWKRVAFWTFFVIAVLVFAASVLYRFGSMWVPSAETRAAYDQAFAAGQAPAIDKQFHIPIPGCVCHSDNPVVTMQHSNRRVSECMGCHGSAGPVR